MYDQILILVVNTGIGVSVYTILDALKPWLRGFFSIPQINKALTLIATKFNISHEAARSVMIKLLVFTISYVIAWNMGVEGDLLVLLERNTETSFIGYGLTAAVIASGDLAVDAYTQTRKTPE